MIYIHLSIGLQNIFFAKFDIFQAFFDLLRKTGVRNFLNIIA